MLKKITTLFLTCSCFFLHSSSPQQNPIADLVKSEQEFAFSFYTELQGKESNQNTIFSPYSIFSCLSMVSVGAQEQTAEEIQKTLHLNLKPALLSPTMGTLSQMLLPEEEVGKNYQLALANGIWFHQDIFLLSSFRSAVDADFQAKLEKVNFQFPEAAITKINAWTSQKTLGKIPHLLQSEDVNKATRLVLTNALYFQGEWLKPFNPQATQKSNFYTTPENPISVDMLEQKSKFAYFENDQFQAAALPFKGKKGAMACLFVLPKAPSNVTELEKNFTSDALNECLTQLKEELLIVKIPKFTLDQRIELNTLLEAMGMKFAFTPDANFSGINGSRDLYLSKVVHAAYFSLDEKGVTAAAATSATINVTSSLQRNPPIPFIADRPFLFYIIDQNTQTLLFMGKFKSP